MTKVADREFELDKGANNAASASSAMTRATRENNKTRGDNPPRSTLACRDTYRESRHVRAASRK